MAKMIVRSVGVAGRFCGRWQRFHVRRVVILPAFPNAGELPGVKADQGVAMADIKEYYERYWDNPDEYYDPTTPQRTALLRAHAAGLAKGSKVLDVGCGRGEFVKLFAEMGYAAEGIDISEVGISYARTQHPDCTFHCGPVEGMLPERKGMYDFVFSSEVIEHLFDVGTYLEAINRLLKPGGLFIITTPYHGLLKNISVDLLNYTKHYDPLGQHIRFFDTKGMRMCLEKWGFAPKVWTGYGRPWPFWKSFFVVSTKAHEA